MGKLYDMEAGRLRRWDRKRTDSFQPKGEDLNWICGCGCWKFEIKSTGVYCCACQSRKFRSITTKL